MINNGDYLNSTNGIKPVSTLPRPWLRTSLLYEYFSESEVPSRSIYPFFTINGMNATDVDFHLNASFDFIKETGFWDDGEKIDEEWWFKNSENQTYKNITSDIVYDQVILTGMKKCEIINFIAIYRRQIGMVYTSTY